MRQNVGNDRDLSNKHPRTLIKALRKGESTSMGRKMLIWLFSFSDTAASRHNPIG
jgi:hypothetical protein